MDHRPDIISPVYKSIIRGLTDMIEELNDSLAYGPLGYHNWEERGLEQDLPQHTLIGTDGFGFEENQGLWNIRFALAISSYRDVNLLTEIELIGAIQQRWGEGQKINLLSLSDGAIAGELVVARFQMLPMAQSELRNYRTIGMSLLRTGT